MTTKRFMILAAVSVCAAYALARADEVKEDPTQKQEQQQKQKKGVEQGEQKMPGEAQAVDPQREQAIKKQTDEILKSWTGRSAEVARATIEKYGQPQEATESMLVWKENGPWAMTIVYSQGFEHNFPMPHEAVIMQFVPMNVPAARVDELANFDGAIAVHRAAGMVSVASDNEAVNFLAINLANEVAKGKKNPNQARKAMVKEVKQAMEGAPTEKLTGFTFEVADLEETKAPDKADKELMKLHDEKLKRQQPSEERMKQEQPESPGTEDETINQPPTQPEPQPTEPQPSPSNR